MAKQIRSLPPGVDSIDEDVVFGTMWIKVGTIKLIRTSNTSYNVLCQFWGETTPSLLTTRYDTPNNEQQRTQRYNIKCPITFFIQYLQEMKNNLRLDVEGVGKVSLDISRFIKKNINIDSRQAFDNFKGFFQIIGKGNRKSGSLEVQMGCDFDPATAVRELGQSAIQEIRKSQMMKCPVRNLQVLQCCGHCECVCPKPPPKGKVTKDPIKQDDPRIPNSLDTKPRQDNSFDANKYIQKQKQKITESKKVQKKQVKILATNDKKEQKIQKEDKKGKEQKKRQDFPQVPKILTYSNLRLNYDNDELQRQLLDDKQSQQSIMQKKWSNQMNDGVELKKTVSQQQFKIIEGNGGYIKKEQRHRIGQSVQDSKFYIKAKPQITKEQLMKQFYGQDNSPFKHHEQMKEKSGYDFMKYQTGDQQKLSRVINLNEELDFKKIGPPPILADSDEVRILPQAPHLNREQFLIDSGMMRKMPMQSQFGRHEYISENPGKQQHRYIPKNEYIPANPCSQYHRYIPKGKTTHSRLMLSLFTQISKSSIVLGTKQPFVIAYRPYGKKQRLTLGPSFGQRIQILSMVGESQVRKMHKTPFIIEFWSSSQNKFLGLVKIDLTKIKQGFLLQDRLNEMAIKTNIVPTIIAKGKIPITDLFDKQVGSCSIYSAIGTQSQLNTYLNQKQNTPSNTPSPLPSPTNPQMPNPQKQPHIPTQTQTKNILTNYDTFLQQLYGNNNKLIQNLNKMMNQKYVSMGQFVELCKSIGVAGLGEQLGRLHGQVDGRESRGIDFHKIADCFDDYMEVIQRIRQELALSTKTIRNLLKDPHSVYTKIHKSSPTKIIPKKKLLQLLQKQTTYHQPLHSYFNKLNQYINIQQFCQNLSIAPTTNITNINNVNSFDLSQLNRQYFQDVIKERLEEKFEGVSLRMFQDVDRKYQNGAQDVAVKDVYWGFEGKICIWVLLHLFDTVNKKHNKSGCLTANWNHLKEQLLNFFNANLHKQPKKKQPIIPHQDPQPIQPHSDPQPQPQPIVDPNPKKPSPKPSPQASPRSPSPDPSILPQDPHPNPSQVPIIPPSQPTLTKHLFSIHPTELSLDHPLRGTCTVVYQFPFQNQQIKSKSLQTSVDKHKYSLKMYGTHGFTIQQDIKSYIGENQIKFYVIIDKKIQFQGALPSDQFVIQPNTQEDKIIPLFCERVEGIAGKIRINVNYERAAAGDNTLGKETTYQLFLPKTGHLNYSIMCQAQPQKIRSQLAISQQFYMCLVLDIFAHNPTLRGQHPPLSSKLFSAQTPQLTLQGSIKLSLTPQTLQYLKSSTCRLLLNIIYYSKQTGNFERKELPYASIQIPLINVIKNQGIKGEYAFKNKLGMFVSLAGCQLKYDKEQIYKFGKEGNDKVGGNSFWVVMKFLEFINFDVQRYAWIKMQFVVKNKKYTTQKLHLQQFSINFLQNAQILLKLSQPQFLDTKVIPITVLTNTSQKLAIDINLKSFTRELSHKKYAINNQNYIIVNQASKPTKMRLALKMYCFHGGPMLTNFVNALYHNLETEVFDQGDMQGDADYDEMVQIFRNNLKFSNKNMQEALSQLGLLVNKEKLSFQFFTNRTYYKLDYTPIIAEQQADIDFICEELDTETSKEEVIRYLTQNNIKLQNFRKQFLQRFSFKQLNKTRADKNVEFLGVENCVDLITFVRKIKILNQQELSNLNNQTLLEDKVVQLTILQGTSFEKLYNGIKPNSLIRIPELGLQTQVSHRNSNPYFNEPISVELDKENVLLLRNMKVEVYHCTADDDDAENILIGQGYLNLNIQQLRGSGKVYKVVIGSIMSHKMKAGLNIKVSLTDGKRYRNSKFDQSSQKVEDSRDVSRLGQIMQDIKHQMAYKNKLFESSDEEY